jgi:predicted dehydrogenase
MVSSWTACWNPGHVRGETAAWRSSGAFYGEPCALLVLCMTNGSFASYEGNNLETGTTNSWHGEYYRLKCEGDAAVLDRDHIVRIEERSAAGTLQTREVPPLEVIWEGYQAIAAQFLDWLDGGPPPTTLADNLPSTAMLFAAIRVSETGTTIDVQEVARQLIGA